MGQPPTLGDLLPRAQRRVLHLELRDHYEGSPAYSTWLTGEPIEYATAYGPWKSLIGPVAARGVDVRRARVISEPLSAYVMFEHAVTPHANLSAGEKVRWLSRSRAAGLYLPVNDFWLVDNLLLFSLFSGAGARGGTIVGNAEAAASAVEAFETVWALGIDHAEYRPA